MKKILVYLMLAGIVVVSCNKKEEVQTQRFHYPETFKSDHVDNYFGIEVADPYQWFENDTTEQVRQWVEAQNEVTHHYLDSIPYRDKIEDRLTELWDYPRYGVPFHKGPYYFYFKNDGLQPQSTLYIQNGLDGETRVFLDPNKLSEDGTVALTAMSVSKDYKYFAYGIARNGSDWNEFYVRDIESGQDLPDHLKWIKFSGIAWYKNGFFYARYDKPTSGSVLSGKNEFHKIFYHTIGTNQSEDKLIYWDPDHPERSFGAQVTDDQRFLLLYGSESTSGTSLYFKNLAKDDAEFTAIDRSFDYEYEVIGNVGDSLYIFTNYKADNYRLVAINTNDLNESNWMEVIPEKEIKLRNVEIAGGKLLAQYIQDVVSKAYLFDLNGKFVNEIELPGPGTMSGFRGELTDTTVFYSFTSFLYPSTIFKYDIATNKSEIFREPEINFNRDDYESYQVFYESRDGTKVPMFITHKKDLVKDGNNPTLLYAYGGFNISITPGFSVSNLVFLENGGVYAVPNLRGGGEYGEAWHKAGMRENKQNVFDDFISAAEYMIAEGYTSSDKLAIRGGSNGGLLIGACMTQRPDLYKVALPAVGVMDMLKFHQFTIGHHWVEEYGSSDDSTQFRYLIAYSPLHNIKESVEYPATLVTTADHDDRVVPAHSFKFISTVQEKYKGNNPVMIRIETKAGHGAGKSTEKLIKEYADIWSFVFDNLGITPIY